MLIDREKAIRELDMPEELFNELLDMFVEQMEPPMKMLEEVTDNTDYEEIRKSAHLIQGSAGNLRIEVIQKIAKQIELDAVGKKNMEIIKKNIAQLRVTFEDVKKELAHGCIEKNPGGG